MEKKRLKSLAIVGAGGWGSALLPATERFCEVSIWAYSKEVADEINTYHTNESYLPGITFPVNVRATNSLIF